MTFILADRHGMALKVKTDSNKGKWQENIMGSEMQR